MHLDPSARRLVEAALTYVALCDQPLPQGDAGFRALIALRGKAMTALREAANEFEQAEGEQQ